MNVSPPPLSSQPASKKLASKFARRLDIVTSRRTLRNSEAWLIAACAFFGAVVGLIVVAMHAGVSSLQILGFGGPLWELLESGGGAIMHWRLLAVPVAGGLLVGLLALAVRRVRPGDIVDPVEANAIYGGRMSVIDSLRVAISTIAGNGAGASVGMEAAYVQMGAGILSWAGQRLKLRRADLRVFVAAGSAAAIAAAFNAPLAGSFYAYELILGSYSIGALAPVAAAALTGTLVVRGILGQAPIYLLHAGAVPLNQWDYPLFGLLGLLAGLLAVAAMRSVTWFESRMRALPLPYWLRPATGGLALGLTALAVPQVLGNGQGAIQFNFDTVLPLPLIVLLLVAKLVGSIVSIGSGFRGGLFSNSLFMGTLFGAVFVQAAVPMLPFLADQRSVFMLVGMGALAAAVVGSPITMVLLVLEVTNDLDIALAVLAGVVVASTLVRATFGYSFGTWRFHQRGVGIRGAHDIGWVSELTVGRLMRNDPALVRFDQPLLKLRAAVPIGSTGRVFAVDADGRYKGMIDVSTIHDPELDDAAAGLVADDLAGSRGVYLLPDQDIRRAMTRFVETEEEMLPVLADGDDRRVVGYLTEAYALRRYTEELERRRNAELGERDLFSTGPSVK